ncbi:DNA internalization-related competence protein ComEC/Rec2 [Luminiphilus sp.]|nr:DNA internalization-related competence protein ComEC/Rec2 [Luminiphilus sp.]
MSEISQFLTLNRASLLFMGTVLFSIVLPSSLFWPVTMGIAICALRMTRQRRASFAVGSGLLVGTFHYLDVTAWQLTHGCLQDEIKIRAEVVAFPRVVETPHRDRLNLLTLKVLDLDSVNCVGIRRISAMHPFKSAEVVPQLGDLIEARVRLKRHDTRWSQGGLPGSVRFLSSSLDARASIRDFAVIKPASTLSTATLRTNLSRAIEGATHSEISRRLLLALLLGRQDVLSQPDWDLLRRFSLTHVFVVSGLHVSLVAVWVAFVLSLPRRLFCLAGDRGGLSTAFVGVSVAAIFYVTLTGSSLPAQRALWMTLLGFFARAILWRCDPASVLCVAAAVLIALNPWSALTPGFWLSIVLTGFILRELNRSNPNGFWAWLRLNIVLALTSSVLSVIFFQQFSLAAVPANLVLVPLLTNLILPLGLFALILQGINGDLAGFLISLCSEFLDVFLAGVSAVDVHSGAWFMTSVWLHTGILLLFACAVLCTLLAAKARLLVSLVLLLTLSASSSGDARFRLEFADVGQATLVIARISDVVMIYDTGGVSWSGSVGFERDVLGRLKTLGIHEVDLLIVSHGDLDHAGGLSSLLSHFSVKTHLGFNGKPCRVGQEIALGKFLVVSMLSGTGHSALNTNADSCVVRLAVHGRQIIMPGDIPTAIEMSLIADQQIKAPVDLLLAPHHGSNSSSSPSFIDALSPKAVFFTTKLDNQFGHPHPSVISRYQRRGSQLWDTGLFGGISVIVRPNSKLSIKPQRQTFSPYWTAIR